MEEQRIPKVTAIVLRDSPNGPEVLLFDHPTEDEGTMVQFPAGTIEPGEAPENAVIRELMEETGVEGRIVDLAGILDQEWKGVLWHRWIYMIEPIGDVKDEWPYHCDCGVPIQIRWELFETATIHEAQTPWLEIGRSFHHQSSQNSSAN